MSRRMAFLNVAVFALLAWVSLAAQQPAAQNPAQSAPATPAKRPNIPDHFTNLQVLPSTITKPELVGIMKQLAITMNVRCSHCHAVSDDLSEGNFASDEKPTKEDARQLLRLIRQATQAKP